jgi:hypothetical protein
LIGRVLPPSGVRVLSLHRQTRIHA